jgi:hypothetical protein
MSESGGGQAFICAASTLRGYQADFRNFTAASVERAREGACRPTSAAGLVCSYLSRCCRFWLKAGSIQRAPGVRSGASMCPAGFNSPATKAAGLCLTGS